METGEAGSTIIHMHSLSRCSTLLTATWPQGCAHVVSFVRYLEFMNMAFETQGNINSSLEYGWSLNVFSTEPRGGLILLPGDARVQDFKKCKDSNVWKCSLFPALTILGGKERERGCFIQGEELNLSSIPSKAHCRDFFCPFSSPFPTSQTILGEVEVSMIDNYFFTPLSEHLDENKSTGIRSL